VGALTHALVLEQYPRMKILLIALVISVPLLSHAGERCQPERSQESLSYTDFPWNVTFEEMLEREQDYYISPKRLPGRAFIDAKGQIRAPIRAGSAGIKLATLTPRFVASVTKHIEEALKRRYVEVVNFTDMGHSHYFIPQSFYDRELADIPIEKYDEFYTKALAHEGLKVLYHTAEQFKMHDEHGQLLSNRHIQWRFFTRNLVGDNRAQGHLELLHAEKHRHNTAHDYDNKHRYWGAGFYLSAHENGCFAYDHKGEVRYFDISLIGL